MKPLAFVFANAFTTARATIQKTVQQWQQPSTLSMPVAVSRTLLRTGINQILPPSCGLCRTPVTTARGLCPDCWRGLEFTTIPFCKRCGMQQPYSTGQYCAGCLEQSPPWDQFRAPLLYNDTAAEMIMQLKYHDRFLLLPIMLRWLLQATRDLPPADAIIPVPLHRRRLWQRRFNQSALLAQRLAQLCGNTEAYQPLWLLREGKFRPQRGLSTEERRRNVEGRFRLDLPAVPALRGRCVWLIDDVVTTGATMDVIARLFQQHQAKVMIVSLSRVKGKLKFITP